jgi:hypothetical protein
MEKILLMLDITAIAGSISADRIVIDSIYQGGRGLTGGFEGISS